MRSLHAIGIMSGTSLDGMDAVLVRLRPERDGYGFRVLAHRFAPFSKAWQEAARKTAARNALRECAMLGVVWSEHAARLARQTARKARIPLRRIDAIGAHGQTLVHHPRPVRFLGESVAFTVQAADLSRLASRTGVTVVGNFRTADVAEGGNGAPLAPHAHRLLFGDKAGCLAVQNLGGIGNMTLLRNGKVKCAFDTGPANLWLDTVIRWKTGGRLLFDRNGTLAGRGAVDKRLLAKLLAHPYFLRKPPKSAGWEEFGPEFLKRYRASLSKLRLEDAMATVTYAAAMATANAYERFVIPRSKPEVILLAGGGAKNTFLSTLFALFLPRIEIRTCSEFGVEPEQLEALSFAVLAVETLRGRPSNEPRATGARRPALCGQIAWGGDPGHVDRLRNVLLR